jgi:hypothetical protein
VISIRNRPKKTVQILWSLARAHLPHLARNAPENSYNFTCARFCAPWEFEARESTRRSRCDAQRVRCRGKRSFRRLFPKRTNFPHYSTTYTRT